MNTHSDIPQKFIEQFDELMRAAELDMLNLWVGYFNGKKRIFICIEVEDEEKNDYIIYPYAVMIDHDKDEIWDFDRRPMIMTDIPEEVRRE